jgi:hypothetical protein
MNFIVSSKIVTILLLTILQKNNIPFVSKDVIRIEFTSKTEKDKLEGIFSQNLIIKEDDNLVIIVYVSGMLSAKCQAHKAPKCQGGAAMQGIQVGNKVT